MMNPGVLHHHIMDAGLIIIISGCGYLAAIVIHNRVMHRLWLLSWVMIISVYRHRWESLHPVLLGFRSDLVMYMFRLMQSPSNILKTLTSIIRPLIQLESNKFITIRLRKPLTPIITLLRLQLCPLI